MKRRGKIFDVFKRVVQDLASGRSLDAKLKDHKLFGNYIGTRECHLEPDWLLIYENHEEEIRLIRMGTHADLFE